MRSRDFLNSYPERFDLLQGNYNRPLVAFAIANYHISFMLYTIYFLCTFTSKIHIFLSDILTVFSFIVTMNYL